MQRRERILAAVVGLLVGGWLLDNVVLTPGLDWLAKVRAEAHARSVEAAEAKALLDRTARITADWNVRHAAGLLDDEDGARFRVQQVLAAGARASGFTIDSVAGGQRVPAPAGQAYDLLRLTVSGQGTLAEAQAFLAGIESAPQPLHIERCELAARDARKDLLDGAVTISTRIVSAAGRTGRTVPASTPAWKPEPRSGALDAAVLAAKPFLADRRASRVAEIRPETVSETRVAASVSRGWAVVGIVAGGEGKGAGQAFMRSLDDGSERIIAAGDEIGNGKAVAVDEAGLHFISDGQERLIPVGYDLAKQPVPTGRHPAATPPPSRSRYGAPAAPATPAPPAAAAPAASAAPAAAPAAPAATVVADPSAAATPAAPATAESDSDRDAILQRLRQQRNHSP